MIDIVSILLGLLAIVIAGLIAIRQHKQLKKLEKIGTETAYTARKLRADTYAKEVVGKFFSLREEHPGHYKCVFPVNYNQRPLPSINAGDYNALHMLQYLIGTDRLELKPLPSNPTGQNPDVPQEYLEGDAIYLCTPQSNRALAELAPEIDLVDSSEPSVPKFKDIELPSWFATDARGQSVNEEGAHVAVSTKKIWIPEIKRSLESGAENDYKEAAKLRPGDVYLPSSVRQEDYAILLRLTHENRKVFVVAGIHQYGTCIGGDFFRRLAAGEELRHRDVLLTNSDFLAVVWGEFNSKTFSVERCDILQDYFWIRKDTSWERVSRDTAASHGS
jgi:hypothetical protein